MVCQTGIIYENVVFVNKCSHALRLHKLKSYATHLVLENLEPSTLNKYLAGAMLGSALAGLSLSQFEFVLYFNYQILTLFSLGLRGGGG